MRSAVRDNHSFLVLRENRLAFAAANRLVAGGRSRLEPVPVTIYGPSGLGKSHLIRQAVRSWREHSPEDRVITITADQFSTEFSEASENKTLGAFTSKYRVPTGLFVCEDLQALDGRTESQQQFVALWNDLIARKTHVLVTLDRSPGELKNVSNRLINRIQGGVCIGIARYKSESREKLITHIAQTLQIPITEAQAQQLASTGPRNGHELTGLLTSLRMRLKARPSEEVDASIEALLRDEPDDGGVSLTEVARAVATEFGTKVSELRSEGRDRRLAVPRQLAMHVMRTVSGANFADIGTYFGGRTHSTVLHSCKRIASQLESDERLRLQLDQIVRKLRRKVAIV